MGISRRGSLTSTANRAIIIKLVEEAVASGARQKQACEIIGLSERILQRWCREGAPADDQQPLAKRPAPANKLIEDDGTDDNKKAQVHLQMEQFLQAKGITLADISKPECLEDRKELILWLKENTPMSGRKLAEVTGINRETIRKILV